MISGLVAMMRSARRRAGAHTLKVQRGEESIRLRAREQQAVAELGRRALSGIGLLVLMDEVVRQVAGVLEVEYCELLEHRSGGEHFLARADVGRIGRHRR